MKIYVINGPSLNMLGIREPEIYGKQTFTDLINSINSWAKELKIEVEVFQSNHEGTLIDFIIDAYSNHVDGIIINPAAYTHTSIALLDALKSVNIPTAEVHLSDINNRESYRKTSFVREYCFKTFMGEGFESYHKALIELKNYLEERYAK